MSSDSSTLTSRGVKFRKRALDDGVAPKPHTNAEPDQAVIAAIPYKSHGSFLTTKQAGRHAPTHPSSLGHVEQVGDYTKTQPGTRVPLLRTSQSNTPLLWFPIGKLLGKQQISLLLLFLTISSNPTNSPLLAVILLILGFFFPFRKKKNKTVLDYT